MSRRVKRGLIIARMAPGSREDVARIFAESDETELPGIVGVRHRSLWALNDLYAHYVETDADFDGAVASVRDHPLFKDVSRRLDEFITPYDPDTWRSPADAMAQQFYVWEPDANP